MKKVLGIAVAVAFVFAVTAVKAEEQKAAAAKAPTAVEQKAATTTKAPEAKVAEPTKAPAAVTTTAKTEVRDAKAECLKKFAGKTENDPAVQNCIKSSQSNVAKANEPAKTPAAVEKKAETTKTEATKAVEKKEEKKN